MGAEAAARLGDEIAHGSGMAAMIGGAAVGALIGAAIVLTAPVSAVVGAVIVSGSIAAGALSMKQLVRGFSSAFKLPDSATGKIEVGSKNTFINGKPAARAGSDLATPCTGKPMVHSESSSPVMLVEGSATVFINGLPVARLKDKLACGAHVKSGSENVFIGGGTQGAGQGVRDIERWVETGFEYLGVAALVGAGAIAASAGMGALAVFGAVAYGFHKTFAGIGKLGDTLGPGYGDMMQGAAGLGLLLAGPRLARPKPAQPAPEHEVSIFGFRGAGSTRDLQGAEAPHPYVVTGHVGYSMDGGKTIYGFGPKVPPEMSTAEAVRALKDGKSFPGVITDDTAVFSQVANHPRMGRNGVPQAVIEQKIPVPKPQFDLIKQTHEELLSRNPMEDVFYRFPEANMPQSGCTFNCATFPKRLGIPIPEATGVMRDYMPQLDAVGMPWKPLP